MKNLSSWLNDVLSHYTTLFGFAFYIVIVAMIGKQSWARWPRAVLLAVLALLVILVGP